MCSQGIPAGVGGGWDTLMNQVEMGGEVRMVSSVGPTGDVVDGREAVAGYLLQC